MGQAVKEQREKEPENFDPEIQKDLNRSEGEGYAVMYQSEKSKCVEDVRKIAAEEPGPSVAAISKEELLEKITRHQPVQIVTVLKPEYYSLGFIPGAKHIPLHELVRRLSELDKNVEAVVYGSRQECAAARRAAELLAASGFKKVRVYQGGIQEWRDCAFPIE